MYDWQKGRERNEEVMCVWLEWQYSYKTARILQLVNELVYLHWLVGRQVRLELVPATLKKKLQSTQLTQ